MSKHFVTLRFLPGEYRDFDAKEGVFECLVDVHSVVAQLEDSGQVPSMEILTDAEFDRDEAIKATEELEEKLSAAENRIENLLNMVDDLESELREARDEIQELLSGDSDMSQEVTNEELEAYWAKVAHDVDHGINGMPKPDWKKILHLDWIIDCWKSELASRRSNPDTL